MRGHKKIGGLLAAVLVLAVLLGIYFGMDQLKPKEDDGELFFRFDKDALVSVTVAGAEGQYTLKKEGDSWHCEELPGTEIDESTVDYRLDVIDEIAAVRTLGNMQENLETYGLEEPRFEMTLVMEDGSSETILIGEESPDGNAYAMRKGESMVYTINTVVQLTMDREPDVYILTEEPEAE